MPLVLQLQSLAQDGGNDVVGLVRRALVVATKLKLPEFADWLNLELSGYEEKAGVPAYRRVPTTLVSHNPYNGTRPVQWGEADEIYRHFSNALLWQPIGSLTALLQNTDAGKGRGQFGVLDAVRKEILRWSLQLEAEGILGEGMSFSPKEKTMAKESQTIHNYGLLVQGNNASAAQAQNSPGAAVSAAQAGDALSRLESLHPELALASPALTPLLRNLVSALRADAQLTAPQKDEAGEQLVALAQQVLAAPALRTPSVSRMIAGRLRDLLGLSADVLQVWGSAAPVFAHLLGLPIA